MKITNNRQEPFVYGSLGGGVISLVPPPSQPIEPPNSQSEVRRDYELALQTGDREGWDAFLRMYSSGYYADLARVQLKKIAAEEARAAAAEKAKLAEQEKVRLAAEGAKQAELMKAAAAAKAAEEARVAAEKANEMEAANVAAAEKARAETEKASRVAGDVNPPQVAALPSPQDEPGSSPASLPKLIQLELRRVGCFSGTADGDWNAISQRALEQYNRFAGTTFDVKLAKSDVLDSIKSRTGRLCPLSCRRGFRAQGDDCVKITCEKGFFLNDDNVCERN